FIKITWNNTTNKELFTAYNIERSSDGGKTFSKINALPFTSLAEQTEVLSYTDSVKNYIPYQYRIVGITPWVDNSNPSIVVKGMGRDKTPAAPPLNTRATGDRSKIMVSWELPVQSKDLKGFTVARSHKLEGPFIAINEKTIQVAERHFIDTKPSPQEPFYAVYSVDTANNMSSTFSVMASIYDSVAPLQPKGLTGRIDSSGAVKLNWKFGSDNDLLGYQVYVANRKNNVYRQITSSPTRDSAWVDSVNMRSLTEEVYYKITAVDYNNNASDYSEILTVKRPDVIPPSAPVITGYAVENGKVSLRWVNSSSTDIVKHSLYRKAEHNSKEEKLLLEYRDNTTQTFIDTTAAEGASYKYEVRAYDDAGYVTPSGALAVTVAEAGNKPGVERFTAQWDNAGRKAKLQWHFSDKGDYELVLFKAGEDGQLKAYKKLKGDKRSFEEALIRGKYRYAIKVIYANGAESALTEVVDIEAS
ncbi:MAG TPA: hypothetical protein VEZ55_12600, partial [Chitinophagaceae bacterium]|nr:hypothetical protein [Chitinophagaceae bacterium]